MSDQAAQGGLSHIHYLDEFVALEAVERTELRIVRLLRESKLSRYKTLATLNLGRFPVRVRTQNTRLTEGHILQGTAKWNNAVPSEERDVQRLVASLIQTHIGIATEVERAAPATHRDNLLPAFRELHGHGHRHQRLAVLEYARKHGFQIEHFIEATASGRGSSKARRLDQLMNELSVGDWLIVSELSRLGRSFGEGIELLEAISKASITFVAIKENIRFEGRQDLQTKAMTTLFALFVEVERELISERTKEGLARARASGTKLGRPMGSLGASRLDGREDEICHLQKLGVSKSSVARITGVSRPTPYAFLESRKIHQ